MDVKCPEPANCQHLNHAIEDRSFEPLPRGRTAQTQEEEAGAVTKLLLHGRQMPWMLQDHHRLQPCPDRCSVLWVLCRPLPAHRRKARLTEGCSFRKKQN